MDGGFSVDTMLLISNGDMSPEVTSLSHAAPLSDH